MIDTRSVDLEKLNSLTKYPSIPTYHKMGDKGRLLPETQFAPRPLTEPQLVVTEKIDGTNTRLIMMPDARILVGSREELLHCTGDLVYNPALDIVASIKDLAERLPECCATSTTTITVLYLETYGGKTTAAAKQYTGHRAIGHRLFDVAVFDIDLLSMPSTHAISNWRKAGNTEFVTDEVLGWFSESTGVELTPRLNAPGLPQGIDATHEWLREVLPNKTHAALDGDGGGNPEGVVVRGPDRNGIAKIRFEDYRRHEKSLRRA